MDTPDGIDSYDWDRVQELAQALVDHADGSKTEDCLRRLLDYLDELELKYGVQPSILATRADFISDVTQREELLLRAYGLAERRGDRRNALYITHSLSELYIEVLKDASEGRQWLYCLKLHLSAEPDDQWFAREHERLTKSAEQLETERA